MKIESIVHENWISTTNCSFLLLLYTYARETARNKELKNFDKFVIRSNLKAQSLNYRSFRKVICF